MDSSAQAGDGSGLLPHTALRRCLDAWVPLLIDECDFAAAFLLLYKPMDEVPGAGQDAFAGERRGQVDARCRCLIHRRGGRKQSQVEG